MPRERTMRDRSPVSYDSSRTKSHRDGTKRKHRDIADDDTTASAGAPVKKKIHLGIQKNRTEHNQNHRSVNELKRRIRDVKRLLARGDLPPDARIVQERALSGYEKDLEDETQKRARSQMIKKYHFVRFLDRKSATKDLNRLLRREKELTADGSGKSSSSSTLESLQKKIHAARVNLNYTIYYPLNDKYISLYADEHKQKQQKETETDPESQTEETNTTSKTATAKPEMWYTVEKCMQDGTLDLLRNGKLGGDETEEQGKKTKKTEKTATGKQDVKKSKSSAFDVRKDKHAKRDIAVRRDKAPPPLHDGDESDGGFFEM